VGADGAGGVGADGGSALARRRLPAPRQLDPVAPAFVAQGPLARRCPNVSLTHVACGHLALPICREKQRAIAKLKAVKSTGL
jgi:hypothetical protein